jgi:hypothetical protein
MAARAITGSARAVRRLMRAMLSLSSRPEAKARSAGATGACQRLVSRAPNRTFSRSLKDGWNRFVCSRAAA